MFAVVKWIESTDLSVVPVSWVFSNSDDRMSYWPAHLKTDAAIVNAVKKTISPDANWTSHKVKCLSVKGRTANYMQSS